MFAEMIALLGMTLVYAVRDSVETIVAVDSSLSEIANVKHASSKNQPSWWGTTRVIKREDVSKLPVRGVQSYILLNPGVVEQDGNLHVRGGRSDEIGYMIEGVSIRNALSGQAPTTVIPEALEEVQFQPGVYSARYGLANSGLINQEFRMGDSVFHANLSVETDNFTPQNERSLGTYSYGYSNYVLTLSGPVIDGRVRLFLAAENRFDRDFGVQFIEGFSFSNLRNSNSQTDTIVPSLELKPGNMPGQMRNRYTANGTLTFDAELLELRFTGAFSSQRQQGTMLPVENIFNFRRQSITRASDLFLKLAADYALTNNVSLNATVFYGDNRNKTFDPDHGDDYMVYEDSISNAKYGYASRFLSRGPDPLILYGFQFVGFGANATRFEKITQSRIGGSASATISLGDHTISVGGSFEKYTLRYFATDSKMLAFLRSNPTYVQGNPKYIVDAMFRMTNSVTNYGYDVYGNEFDEGLDKSKKPILGSLYMEDALGFSDFSISLGLRYDILDLNLFEFVDDPTTPGIEGSTNPSIDPVTFQVRETGISPVNAVSLLSPRVSFAINATKQLGFHAAFGRFVQPPPLEMIYSNVDMIGFSGRNFIYPAIGNFRPSQTVHYEIGATYVLPTIGKGSLVGFLKRTTDQFGVSAVTTSGSSGTTTYYFPHTDGASRQRGIELNGAIDRIGGFSSFFSYSLINSESDPGGVPTAFNHEHRVVVSVDYRFDSQFGAILADVGVSALMTYQNGHPFTLGLPLATGGMDPQNAGLLEGMSDPRLRSSPNSETTPSNSQIDLRIDKEIRIGMLRLDVFAYVHNLFNTKNVSNSYMRSGVADDDGFINTPVLSGGYINGLGPRYVDLYRAINLQNGQAYRRATGTSLWGAPRQIRFGVRVDV